MALNLQPQCLGLLAFYFPGILRIVNPGATWVWWAVAASQPLPWPRVGLQDQR